MWEYGMYGVDEYQAKAEDYEALAQATPSIVERDRLLRMKRSYALMARSAQFTAKLDGVIAGLTSPLVTAGARRFIPH